MLPHDGVGGWTPTPRNDKLASSVIAFPRPSAAETITGVSALGRIWRASTRRRDKPSASAPSTNGRAARSEERRVGKECVGCVDLGGRRIIKKKKSSNERYPGMPQTRPYWYKSSS